MEADIVTANEAFYAAFRDEDVAAMDALWSQTAPVACVHPGWPALIGREQVMASWRAIISNGAPPIRCGAARVLMLGDVAQVICEERIGDGRLIATNVFVREATGWAMVHHHASQVVAPAPTTADEDDDTDDSDDADDIDDADDLDDAPPKPDVGPN